MNTFKQLKLGLVTLASIGMIAACGGGSGSVGTASGAKAVAKTCPSGIDLVLRDYVSEEGAKRIASGAENLRYELLEHIGTNLFISDLDMVTIDQGATKFLLLDWMKVSSGQHTIENHQRRAAIVIVYLVLLTEIVALNDLNEDALHIVTRLNTKEDGSEIQEYMLTDTDFEDYLQYTPNPEYYDGSFSQRGNIKELSESIFKNIVIFTEDKPVASESDEQQMIRYQFIAEKQHILGEMIMHMLSVKVAQESDRVLAVSLAQMNDLSKKNMELDSRIDDLKSEKANLQSQKDDLQSQNDDLQSQNDDLQSQKADLTSEKADLQFKFDVSKGKVEALDKQIVGLNAQIAGKDKEIAGFIAKVNKLSSDKEALTAEKERLEAKYDTDIAGLESKLDDMQNKTEALTKQLSEALAQKSKFERMLSQGVVDLSGVAMSNACLTLVMDNIVLDETKDVGDADYDSKKEVRKLDFSGNKWFDKDSLRIVFDSLLTQERTFLKEINLEGTSVTLDEITKLLDEDDYSELHDMDVKHDDL